MLQEKSKKKLNLKQTVETLAVIAEEHLATMSEAEQDARIAALAHRAFRTNQRRGKLRRRIYPPLGH